MVISTAAGAGAKKAAALCSDVLFNWGIPKIYTYGINVNAFDWEHTPSKKKTQIQRKTDFLAKEISKKNCTTGNKTASYVFTLPRNAESKLGRFTRRKRILEKTGLA